MQAAYRAGRAGKRVVILHEDRINSAGGKTVQIVGLRKEPAMIAKALGRDQLDFLNCKRYQIHCQYFSSIQFAPWSKNLVIPALKSPRVLWGFIDKMGPLPTLSVVLCVNGNGDQQGSIRISFACVVDSDF